MVWKRNDIAAAAAFPQPVVTTLRTRAQQACPDSLKRLGGDFHTSSILIKPDGEHCRETRNKGSGQTNPRRAANLRRLGPVADGKQPREALIKFSSKPDCAAVAKLAWQGCSTTKIKNDAE